jgi:nucleoid DNA-binding protein
MSENTTPIAEAMNKTTLINELATNTELSTKQIKAVLDELASTIERHLTKDGAGSFTLPGLLKISTVVKPARPAQSGVPNPFKPGEMMDVAAKPASTKVKVTALKKLKLMPPPPPQ